MKISFDIIKLFLEKGFDCNAVNIKGETFLHRYLTQSDIDIKVVELILDKFDINRRFDIQSDTNNTILHTYMKLQNVNRDIIKLFFDKGFDVNITNSDRDTILHIYIRRDIVDEKIITLAINKGFDLELKNLEEKTIMEEYFFREYNKKMFKIIYELRNTFYFILINDLKTAVNEGFIGDDEDIYIEDKIKYVNRYKIKSLRR